MHAVVFFNFLFKLNFSSSVLKVDVKSRKIMTTSVSILRPAVHFSNVTIKAGVDGSSVKYAMSQPFSALHCNE